MHRIQKLLSNYGYCSRRKAEDIIKEGRVKVNGKIATLGTALKSGDMVEITIDKKRNNPSEEWLKTAQTHLAKEKIKQSLKKNNGVGRFLNIFNK